MPSHPAAPEELPDLVEGFRQAMRSLIDLGRSCPAGKAEEPTSCPGWTVKDHFAHIASVEAFLDGGPYPLTELTEDGHLRSEFTRWLEHGVQARREHSLEEVLAELETVMFNRLASLGNPDLTLETPVRAPLEKTMSLGELLRRRLIDIWVHEQDVREALGRIGNLDSPAAATFVARIVDAFPRVVTRRLSLPAGQTVILESTGPVTARTGVRMAHNEDGEVVGHELFTGSQDTAAEDAADQEQHPEEDVESTTISMSTEALTRRSAGRRLTQDSAYKVVGSQETARAVLDALVMTP
ncbi:MAG TPA: maleylpyruvate isomerase family mycothiol-dependent enzyme [Ornithinimicrobium sp.]|uniref:maleylpyruvate isomerase family mycothiol-dependent enzyme n=1 Tax=Ornithinimicrobium sp. TaxID=1977084 RepID=UPI002B45C10C|nr:maleylpyruvate isomerase family mycothiol-dependent enzyme [Ornithinimicrobium sp.]HKJ11268.1 maleylpyruvate isomerase family mycothiol-dependent enzyme [Ornithinimicrobium sp.]